MKDTKQFLQELSRITKQEIHLRNVTRKRAVVMILLVESNEQLFVLFQERSPNIPQPNEISFPGGLTEENDLSIVDTALRETEEELGISRDMIQIVGRIDSLITRLGMQIDVVVGKTSVSLEKMDPNKYEVERLFALPLSWLMEQKPEFYQVLVKSHPTVLNKETGETVVLFPSKELGLPAKYHDAWGEMLHKVILYHTPEGIIWGITADILLDFLNLCKNIEAS